MNNYLRRNRHELRYAATLIGITAILGYWIGEPAIIAENQTPTNTAVAPVAPDTTTEKPTPPHAATAQSPAVRLPSIQATTPPSTTPPIVTGHNGTTIEGRCTQYEPLLTELAPPGGWAVEKMSRYMSRESGCCPGVRGGDVLTSDCTFVRVSTYTHRSDVGLFQINGINYNPARCGSDCIIDNTLTELKDPRTNIQAAADLCVWWMNAGRSCYQAWGG